MVKTWGYRRQRRGQETDSSTSHMIWCDVIWYDMTSCSRAYHIVLIALSMFSYAMLSMRRDAAELRTRISLESDWGFINSDPGSCGVWRPENELQQLCVLVTSWWDSQLSSLARIHAKSVLFHKYIIRWQCKDIRTGKCDCSMGKQARANESICLFQNPDAGIFIQRVLTGEVAAPCLVGGPPIILQGCGISRLCEGTSGHVGGV